MLARAGFAAARSRSHSRTRRGTSLDGKGDSSAHAGRPQPYQPYQLYTHCGIDEERIGDYYFEAVHPLSDGHGNPLLGWGNPYQQGTMTLLSPAEAVFRDRAGHQVRFRLRSSAKTFKHVCA